MDNKGNNRRLTLDTKMIMDRKNDKDRETEEAVDWTDENEVFLTPTRVNKEVQPRGGMDPFVARNMVARSPVRRMANTSLSKGVALRYETESETESEADGSIQESGEDRQIRETVTNVYRGVKRVGMYLTTEKHISHEAKSTICDVYKELKALKKCLKDSRAREIRTLEELRSMRGEMEKMMERDRDRELEMEKIRHREKERERVMREEVERIKERDEEREREMGELRKRIGRREEASSVSKRKNRSPNTEIEHNVLTRRVRRKEELGHDVIHEIGEGDEEGEKTESRETNGSGMGDINRNGRGPANNEAGEWSIVDRRKEKRKGSEGTPRGQKVPLGAGANEDRVMREESGKGNRGGARAKEPRVGVGRTGPRNEAICVTAGEKTYAEVFKEIASKAKGCLNDIKMVRRSRKGDLIVEYAKTGSAAKGAEAIHNGLGEGFSVRTMVPKVEVQIRDLDPICDTQEIIEGFCKAYDVADRGEVRVKLLRTTYMGTQLAILEAPAALAAKIETKDRAKIGYMSARVRVAPRVLRCFRCHDFGHMGADCTNKGEGVTICRRCGNEGHVMSTCTNVPSCILCQGRGLPDNSRRHVAGSFRCPRYQEALRGNRANNKSKPNKLSRDALPSD
ncbi:zinc finger CCCH domain-containing protein 13-like [Colletes gigas]|uniref:zinc finger CCCH domain-containing protein 13-like n=1 Tax=Colletes gigas TaxID=935657 RepID=UPI001C9B3507|nr:zinc finger CCCH domain-containing protein 13-like [Colletes gigas]